MAIMRRGNVRVVNNTWPGFVDAMAALLLVLTFVLSIFMVVQSVLRDTIVNQDRVLNNLYVQISDLHEVLELTETELVESEMESRLQQITISTLNVSVNEAMQKIDEFKETIDQLLSDKLNLERTLDRKSSELNSKIEELVNAEGMIVSLSTKMEILSLEKTELENLLAFLRSDLLGSKNLLIEANAKLVSFEEQVASLIAQRTDLRMNIANLEEESIKSLTRSKAARLALASARSEISIEQENARLAAARAELLESEILALKEQQIRSTTELEEIEVKLDQTDLALYLAQENLMELEFERDSLVNKLAETVETLSEIEKQTLAEKIVTARLRKSLEEEKEETSLLALTLAGERKRAIELLSSLALIREEKDFLSDTTIQLQADKKDLEKTLAFREILMREMEVELIKSQEISDIDSSRILKLESDAKSLGTRLAELQALLDKSNESDAKKNIQIETLGKNLNAALARVATEQKLRADLEEAERKRIENEAKDLRSYRSEFFGEMKKIMSEIKGIKIVGDRFLFSSEVLFSSASAELNRDGKVQISAVAEKLKKVTDNIPEGIRWILRVDGHTDSLPLISNSQYKDNWELSQARALAVVKFLIEEEEFPADKLAATGFGSHQPLAIGNSPSDFGQNRRIELKITEK